MSSEETFNEKIGAMVSIAQHRQQMLDLVRSALVLAKQSDEAQAYIMERMTASIDESFDGYKIDPNNAQSIDAIKDGMLRIFVGALTKMMLELTKAYAEIHLITNPVQLPR